MPLFYLFKQKENKKRILNHNRDLSTWRKFRVLIFIASNYLTFLPRMWNGYGDETCCWFFYFILFHIFLFSLFYDFERKLLYNFQLAAVSAWRPFRKANITLRRCVKKYYDLWTTNWLDCWTPEQTNSNIIFRKERIDHRRNDRIFLWDLLNIYIIPPPPFMFIP